jgi:murein L,D-transpeptidase YcbB/YkuD
MRKFILIVLLFFLFVSCKRTEFIYASATPFELKSFKKEVNNHSIDSTLLLPFSNSELTSFYRMNHFRTVWNSSENRNLVAKILSKAGEEGLNPEDYQAEGIFEIESRIKSLSEKELVNYDISITLAVQKYMSHLSDGKLNPRELYDDWDLKVPKFDLNKNLTNAINGDSLSWIFEKIKPKHIIYKRLKNALSIINSMPIDTLKLISTDEKLKPYDSSATLLSIKQKLIYWKDLKPKDSLTKIYDEETVKSIKKFQKRHGLASDGIIGKATILALNTSKDERRRQIIANLERWKWFPKDMSEHYVIINIPEFKLYTVFKNDTTSTHNIIVGTQKRKTPILNSKLNSAVFNPTWTVPPTILKEDIIPATIKNRNYLGTKNIKIYDSNGNEISVWKWNPEKALNYRYVQSPGTFNSLGMVKILFPNNYTVYLHDTNHREYFEKTDRSLSSGCVRVQNPLEFTEYLLDDKVNWNLEKITEILKTEKTQNVKIKNDIYIYQLYWTAWSDKNTLQFRPDIYDLDSGLYTKLRD